MPGRLYSQLQKERYAEPGAECLKYDNRTGRLSLCLANENDDSLFLTSTTFVALMAVAEQRGWRATAFTRNSLSAFSAADASRCAVILRSALEDGIPPTLTARDNPALLRIHVERDQLARFVAFCRQGGFWIREANPSRLGGE
jgi:hypothetical protein